jgi:hypothetical protein
MNFLHLPSYKKTRAESNATLGLVKIEKTVHEQLMDMKMQLQDGKEPQ